MLVELQYNATILIMNIWKSFINTSVCIIYSMLPQKEAKECNIHSSANSFKSVKKLMLSIVFFRYSKGEVTVFLPLVKSIAAPFILFRLKRSGLSESKVTVDKEGTYITARH
ncbi:MAG: hypothetical protein FWD70_04170 [Desulfuromonadales bacterium]|nr:hypothetical protein [Desulfuromonadales bacterium]